MKDAGGGAALIAGGVDRQDFGSRRACDRWSYGRWGAACAP